ncbi:MAG: hypothetical protein P4L27_10845, partial [Ignavibacteriaceae bacterium]|nr:hypothetical protein [Ignavibacteriaceae bacterium]
CKYIGSGNINSKIWFVGIEEGGDPITEKNLEEQLVICRNESQYFKDASSKTPVWGIIADLLYDKYLEEHKLGKKEYRQNMFNKDYSYFFLAELFPLPRPNTSSWSEDYNKIFGYSKDDYKKYLSDVRSFRYPIIYKKWIEVKPSLTICLGSSYWNEFINLFNLGHSRFINLPGSSLIKYPDQNIILAPFFDYRRIKSEDRITLKQIVNDVRV